MAHYNLSSNSAGCNRQNFCPAGYFPSPQSPSISGAITETEEMSWARICMEHSWTRVSAILLMLGWIMPESLEAGQIDSSRVKVGSERSALAHHETQILDRGVRIAGKMLAGTASGIAVATISTIALVIIFDDGSGPSEGGSANPWDGLAYVFGGILIGSGVGFPLGVTWIDPHDSSSKTMFAGIASVGVAISLAAMTPQDHSLANPALLSPLFLPAISSIVVSELSRKPPEDRRVSVGWSPTPHGGLFAMAKLRF